MVLRMKNFWGVRVLKKNQYRGVDCLKKGGGGAGTCTVSSFKVGLGKKEGVVFLRGMGLIPQYAIGLEKLVIVN